MMIRKIRIKNFQSLASVSLDLAGFTALEGPSNVGKSAVVRALKAVVNNARGTDMVRHGTTEATVTVDLDDGSTIAWVKGKRSKYVVNDETYDKIGLDVPDIVHDKLKMGVQAVGSTDVDFNIHSQLTGPFFVGQSGPNRSKIIGTITHYDAIQSAVTEANKEKKQYQAEVKDIEQQIHTLDQRLARFEPVRHLQARIPALEQEDQAIAQARGILDQKVQLLREFQSAMNVVDSASRMVASSDDLQDVFTRFDTITQTRSTLLALKQEYQQAQGFLQEYRAATEEIEAQEQSLYTLTSTLARYERELAAIKPVEICPTCGQEVFS